MKRIILALGILQFIPIPLSAQVIVYSLYSNRANPLPLHDATLTTGPVYIFVPATTGLSRVVFKLDGSIIQTEASYPWDFKGGTSTAANPFDLSTLPYGDHSIVADLTVYGVLQSITALFHYPAPVTPAIINPTLVIFGPSPDHTAIIEPNYADAGKPVVSGYLANVYRFDDQSTLYRQWDLLKPDANDIGLISASIRDYVLGLVEGEYILRIVVIGPGGMSDESGSSDKFKRVSPGPNPSRVDTSITVK